VPQPPELSEPYLDESSRSSARALFEHLEQQVAAAEQLVAATLAQQWSSSERERFPDYPHDLAVDRLRRWVTLFAEEISVVHQLVEAGRPLDDGELRRGVYLASQLIEILQGAQTALTPH
jgi:hypothetical protein